MASTGSASAEVRSGGGRRPLFLLDGNNIAYRAFFALPQEIATSSGFPTNALYGFCLMLTKVLGDYHPETVIVAWDSREKTFRHEEFEEYKAQRKPMPELLSEQWPFFAPLSEAFGFANLAVPGWEADDILATLARQAETQERKAVIVTGDKDALQLASEYVSIMANTKGMTEVRVYDPAAVEERFGVPPRLIPDLIGLKGDSSDNIPGVPGIGEKIASELLSRFGSLEEVLDRADEVSGPKRRELLKEHRDVALLSKKLASLHEDAPIEIDTVAEASLRPQRQKLAELLAKFEFATLFTRVEPLLAECETAGENESEHQSEHQSEHEGSGSSLGAGTVLEPGLEGVAMPAPDTSSASGGETAGLAGTETTELALPRSVPASSADRETLEGLLDWTAPVGMATQEDGSLWLAQSGSQGGGGEAGASELDYPSYIVLNVEGPLDSAEVLRGLLARGPRLCHDYKSSSLLHGLVGQVDHDTYLAGYLLDPGQREYQLRDLAVGMRVPTPSAEAPGAVDSAQVLSLAAKQAERLRALGMWDLFESIELPLTSVLLAMEKAGVRMDCYSLGEITGKVQDQLEEIEASVYELAGEEFNLGSPQQLSRILFEKLELPRQRKTKTGYSTDAKTLEALRASHPIVEHILGHRELSKLLSTYLVALPQAVDPDTGRLHTTFHQAVTATGRLSSSDPNLQNIPVRTPLGVQIRGCFEAEPGNLLVVADYSQIELRVMAHLSGESALLEAFARGEDIHTRTAAEVFGLTEDQVDAKHRRYAKAVNFGIMYGQTAYGLSQTLGIDRDEAGEYIERYFERLPKVKEFTEKTIEQATTEGYAATVFGRRRPIPELRSDNFQERSLGERLAVNSVIQGSAADIIKVAMIRCHSRLEEEFPGARLVLQVHDELVFEVPEKVAEAVKEAVVEVMVGAYTMDPPLGVEAGVGSDWASAK